MNQILRNFDSSLIDHHLHIFICGVALNFSPELKFHQNFNSQLSFYRDLQNLLIDTNEREKKICQDQDQAAVTV